MRQCPHCQTPHPDDVNVCELDGTPLLTQTRPLTLAAPSAMGSGTHSHDDQDIAFDETSHESSPKQDRSSGARPTAAARPPSASAKPASQPAPQKDDAAEDGIGRVLGSYRLLEVIGRGGMGRVYLAEHVRLGRRVALKVLRPEYAVKRDSVARFFQEAKAVNKIRHRNIVDVTDFVELDDGTTFIIMELLRGVSLGRVLRTQGPPEHARTLYVVAQVCDALEAAHSVGIVHRDLKPDNIFLTRDDMGGELVKLLDFGVAKLLSQDDFALQTAAGSVVGTPAYMSPEQAAGLDVDGRSDVYALGAILYELCTGQPLFRARAFGEYVNKHMNEVPIPPRTTPGGGQITEELEEVILKCLEKKAEDRYPNVGQLREAILGQMSLYATGPTNLTPRLAPSSGPWSKDVRGVASPTPRAAARSRHAWSVVAIGAAAGLAAGVYVLLSSDQAAQNAATPAMTGPESIPNAPPRIDPPPARSEAIPSPGTIAQELPARVQVRFDSDPREARVFRLGSDELICSTPCKIEIDPRDGGATDKRVYLLRHPGYHDATYDVPLESERHDAVVMLLPKPGTSSGEAHRRPSAPKPPKLETPDKPVGSGQDGKTIDPTDTLNPFGRRSK